MSDLLTAPEFAQGLRAGVVVLVAGLLIGGVWRLAWHRSAPVGGYLVAVATVAAIEMRFDVPREMLIGLGLLALAGLVGDLQHAPLPLRAALAVPGAWILATRTEVPGPSWVRASIVVTAVIGGALATDLDRRWRRPAIAPGLIAISVLGVYFTVPDTELPLAMIAPAVLIAALAWPIGLVRLGSGGAFAVAGLLAWVSAVGGVGRAGSVVGGLATLGLLVIEPLSRIRPLGRFNGPLVPRPGFFAALTVGAAHGLLVLFVSRVAGFRQQPREAAVLAVVAGALSLAGCATAARLLRRGRTTSRAGGPEGKG